MQELFYGDPPTSDPDYFNCEFRSVADVALWIDTQIAAGGTALALLNGANAVSGGAARSITGAADTNGRNIQLGAAASQGSGILIQASKPVRYLFRLRPTLANLGDQQWGLSIYNDQAIIAGVTDFIGFKKASGTTRLTASLKGAGTEVTLDTGVDLTNATFLKACIDIYKVSETEGEVVFHIERNLVGRLSTTPLPLQTVNMVPAFEHIANGGGGAMNLDLDYVRWRGVR